VEANEIDKVFDQRSRAFFSINFGVYPIASSLEFPFPKAGTAFLNNP